MTKVNTTIRLDFDLKTEASSIAKELGTNLNTVISLYLKNTFLIDKWISVSLRDNAWFTKKAGDDLKKLIEESKDGKGVSKPYADVHNLINDLRNDAVKY